MFCPDTMIRYDNTTTTSSALWVCRICARCLLSESAARQHLFRCNDKPSPSLDSTVENARRMKCRHCDRKFAVQVALKTHEESHLKPQSQEASNSDVDMMSSNRDEIYIETEAFCPDTMVKYENTPNTSSGAWVCRICLSCLLSESAARDHFLTCD